MTKRIISLCIALLFCASLFAGCGETLPPEPAADPTPELAPTPELTPTPEPEIIGGPFSFSRENMPRMDGSTSLVPLAQAATSVLLGESREDTGELTLFNRTSQSYYNLMWDYCDILIASWPAESVFEELSNSNFLYEMEPIATDALIFVVNENNPVDNLTTEEIIGIYSGEITNWSQVGGFDEPIAAFQRNSGAGSQALMEKLVMGDTPMMTPPTELMASSMGELMEYVKSYDNSATAIGYSVYYYAKDMRMAEGLKIIAVDGMEPTDENIRSGAYPHLSNYYTVIGVDEVANSPARVMFEWLQSAEGQRLVEQEGYVPVMDLGESPESKATSGGFIVETHWDALTSAEIPEAKYSRLGEERIEALEARDDYGALYPFVGQANYADWGASMPVYGLFDQNGRIVCDPVYSGVERLSYWDGSTIRFVPMLGLRKSSETTPEGLTQLPCTIASLDGSFVSPVAYNYVWAFDFGVLCAQQTDGTEFTIYDFEGKVLMTEADLQLGELELNDLWDISEGRDGYLLARIYRGDDARVYLIGPNGKLFPGDWYSAEFIGNERLVASPNHGLDQTGVSDYEGNWIIEPEYEYISRNAEGGYLCTKMDGHSTLFDSEGQKIASLGYGVAVSDHGYISGKHFYRPDGSYFVLDAYAWHSVRNSPLIYREDGTNIILMNVISGKTLSIQGTKNHRPMLSQLTQAFAVGPYSSLEYVMVWTDDSEYGYRLIDWELETYFATPDAAPGITTLSTLTDGFTGEEYICIYDRDLKPLLYSAKLEPIAHPGQWVTIWNGYLMHTDNKFCTYTDKSGEIFFRYPLMPGGD